MELEIPSPENVEEIRELFNLVFKKPISREYFHWLDENPSGDMIQTVMKSKGEIIGYYSLIPFKLQGDREIIDCALSVGTMTHPAYRKKGVFTKLAKETYKIAGKKGVRFICGFPNSRSYPSFINKLSWFHICDIPLLILELDQGIKEYPAVNTGIRQVSAFNSGNDYPPAGESDGHLIRRLKNERYLNWRYDTVKVWDNSPPRKYMKYVIKNEDTKNVLGYVILKLYDGGDDKTVHIVDISTVMNRADLFRSLLSIAREYAILNNAKTISCWMLKNTVYWDMLVNEGFGVFQGVSQPFTGFINSTRNSIDYLKEESNWFITMGDSDVF